MHVAERSARARPRPPPRRTSRSSGRAGLLRFTPGCDRPRRHPRGCGRPPTAPMNCARTPASPQHSSCQRQRARRTWCSSAAGVRRADFGMVARKAGAPCGVRAAAGPNDDRRRHPRMAERRRGGARRTATARAELGRRMSASRASSRASSLASLPSRVAPVGFDDRKRTAQGGSNATAEEGDSWAAEATHGCRAPTTKPRLVLRSPMDHGRGRHQRPLRRRPPSPASRRPSGGFANSTSGSSMRASALGAGRSTSISPPSRRSPTPWSAVPDRATSSGSRASRPPKRTSFAT
jgi:hypothetical protein